VGPKGTDATRRTVTVAAASEEASQGAQAVAAAVDEVNASIAEIAKQVHQSAVIAGTAVNPANSANTEVNSLSLAALKIGDVVKLICEIAARPTSWRSTPPSRAFLSEVRAALATSPFVIARSACDEAIFLCGAGLLRLRSQ
jgi:hypothetical protein